MASGSKRSKREARRRQAQAKARRNKILIWSGVGVVALAIVSFLVFQPLPDELADVETFANIGQDHLETGENPPIYNSSPASSGNHASVPAQCGIYVSEIPDQVQVHNLEHGAVVIQYQPDLDPDGIVLLQIYARSKSSHILLAPRAGLSDPVVLTSWTRMLRLPSGDIETIDLYYDHFAFTGPEVGVPCPFAVDESV